MLHCGRGWGSLHLSKSQNGAGAGGKGPTSVTVVGAWEAAPPIAHPWAEVGVEAGLGVGQWVWLGDTGEAAAEP